MTMKKRYLELLKGCVTRIPFEDVSAEELEFRRVGHARAANAETMIGLARLDNIERCADAIFRDGVPGDFLEAGVWRGGSCIFMRALIDDQPGRRVWVADSFEGLPPSTHPIDVACDSEYKAWGSLAVSRAEVESNFRRYNLLDSRVCFLPGFFRDTLPGPVDDLALLRVDGDMYESVTQTLEALYSHVASGGFVIIDDYAGGAARKATDDFRRRMGVSAPLEFVDWTGVCWRV